MNAQWTLVAGHLPHPLLAAGVLAVATFAVLEVTRELARRRHASQPAARRQARALWLAAALRTIGLLAIVVLGFELSLRVEARSPARQRVAVLVDDSASMGIPDAASPNAEPTPRFVRAERHWQAAESTRQAWTRRGIDWDVRHFAAGPAVHESGRNAARALDRGSDPQALWHEAPHGEASQLGAALASFGDDPLSAVVVISDGLVASDDAERDQLLETATAAGVPITTFDVGAPALVDVSIAALRCGEFAFVENVVTFEVDVESHGLAGEKTHVELFRDGQPIAFEPITLGEDGAKTTVKFERAPDRVGQFVYEFRVPEHAGEATNQNNRQAFVVNVLRDKVRVLHVAGRPNWDVRALRTLLKRDPNVELLSYYILRDWEDSEREDRTAKLSLIAFPTDELFYDQLGSFDLLVLHNFDAVRYGAYLDNIASYVRDGGALVVIGGGLGLATGDYAAPQLASLLPVETRRPTGVDRSPYRPQLTEAGRRHPITAWISRAEGEWEGLPELDDFNLTGHASGSQDIAAATLLAHPDVRGADGQPAPVLAVAEPGHGRTMVLATGASWRLGFAPDLALIDGSRPFDLLWLGAVRWLLRDASSERLILDLDRATYRVGDPVTVQVRTLGPSYAPEPSVVVDWQLRPLDEDTTAEAQNGEWTTDASGRAKSTLSDLPRGAYELTAQRRGASTDAPIDRARRVFLVEAPVRELARIDADRGAATLRSLAQATGGEALVAIDNDQLPERLAVAPPSAAAQRSRLKSRRDYPLWQFSGGWLWLAILTTALAGEWWLRRRCGLA
ncbi:MAG: hypothetical protein B7733_10115 [Myxococcales bacterium FL481]|nr:MAG: hypothetical protein B7733_10115 [Myxococcales bacterium FL481]